MVYVLVLVIYMTKPYVGITGFKTVNEVRVASKAFLEHGYAHSERTGMLGILTSTWKIQQPQKEGKQSPALRDIPQLCNEIPVELLPMIHYHTPHDEYEREVMQVFDTLYENNLCRAVQLNMLWPDPAQLARLRKEMPELQVVLQLPKAVTQSNLADIGAQLREYDGLCEYVLVDPSGGKGKPYDFGRGMTLMQLAHEELSQATIGIAGGLSANNVEERMKEVSDAFAQTFCVDAQGRLRSDDKRSLNLERTVAYIRNASS